MRRYRERVCRGTDLCAVAMHSFHFFFIKIINSKKEKRETAKHKQNEWMFIVNY